MAAVFLLGYGWSALAPRSFGTVLFLACGVVLLVMSVASAGRLHRVFALVAFAAFGAVVVSGHFEAAEFFEGMPTYFGIVAVLLVLSVAGYPIRAARYEAQIQALMAALMRRGASPRATAGILGQVLGAVLDVGSLVLTEVIFSRAAPAERLAALKWAARGFSFAFLWTNLNIFTATIIVLTGVTYPGLLAVSLPFVVIGLAVTLLAAQRESSGIEDFPDAPLDRGTAAVLLYPVLLISAVAVVNQLSPDLSLSAAIALTVTVVVAVISAIAALVLRSSSPIRRLGRETRGSLASSASEFALFGCSGVLVLSLEALGALAPLGDALRALPEPLVAPALMLIGAIGFISGIHILPLVLLIDSAFPLSEGPAPALWAVALLLGCQIAVLLTPFSNSVTMLARLARKDPLEVGFKTNWRFALVLTLAALLYLGLLTYLLL